MKPSGQEVKMNRYNYMTAIAIIAFIVLICVMLWALLERDDTPVEASQMQDFVKDLYEDLIQSEGYRLEVYKDSEGNLTAGVGHLLTDEEIRIGYVEGDNVPKRQVEDWLRDDVSEVIDSACRTFKEFNSYPHLVKLAIANWMYQLGDGAPSEFPRATEYLKQRNWHSAALEWKYANVRTKRLSNWWRETPHRCQQESDRLMHAAEHGY